MNSIDVLIDSASWPVQAAHYFLTDLTEQELNAHPGGHNNSIAWLLWHTGREIDVQVQNLGGKEVWAHQGFRERFDMGDIGDSIGYGHTPEQARSVVINDAELLLEYIDVAIKAFQDYVGGLSEEDLDEIIDTSWNPPVTRGARLVSMVSDADQHIGQAAYALGQLRASA